MKKIPGVTALFLVSLFSSVSFAAQQQMIVKLKSPNPALAAKAERHLIGGNLLLITADPAALRANPSVEWAEPNLAIHGLFGPHPPAGHTVDPRAWGVKQTHGSDGWLFGKTGKGVVVAVLDTGVALDHPALAKNIVVNTLEIAKNGKDDDANGFIDDVMGWNFVGNNNDPSDDHGHGTHCAGIIAGDKVGVAPDAQILAVKILDSNLGGTIANAVDGIHYAIQRGAKIISNSWYADGFSQALLEAIQDAQKAGVWFVTGAGNAGSNNDVLAEYPASYDMPNVISVAATDTDDVLTDASNWGTTVHLAAPGANIFSTVLKGQYDTYSGTSMAAALVSGAVAILRQSAITDIRTRLIKTSDPTPNLRVLARGRLNIYNAVSN